MATGQKNRLTHFLKTIGRAAPDVGDGPLLRRFVRERDGDAFAALVRRHGPMVLGVCRRVLGNPHDADDAFQAVFLVLARKAGSVAGVTSLGAWLARVAYRAAYRARHSLSRLQRRERTVSDLPHPTTATADPDDLLPLLDREIDRLPDKYRVPVVLCELEGKTRRDAARLLGLAEGTLSSRLAHARKLLARRLARHRAALGGATLAGLLAPEPASAELVRAATGAALQCASNPELAGGVVSARVLTLAQGVMKAMFLTRLKVYGVVLVLLVGAGTAGLAVRPATAQDPAGSTNRPRDARWSTDVRWTADVLEELRLEVAALRKGLEVTRDEMKSLRAEVQSLRTARPNAPRSAVDGDGTTNTKQETQRPFGTADNTEHLIQFLNRTNAPQQQGPQQAAQDVSHSAQQLAEDLNNAFQRIQQQPDQAKQKATNERQGELWKRQSTQASTDALSDAEAALKWLRAHPGDKRATDELEKALQRLRQPQPKAISQPQKQ